MTRSRLSASDAVVIFADMELDVVELPLTVDAASLRRAARGLATLAEVFDLPTLVITRPTHDGRVSEIIPEIIQARTSFQHHLRTNPDSFETPAVRESLATLGRSTLLVCGVSTEVVVQRLVLSGRAYRYEVQIVTDACGGLSHRTERAVLTQFTAAGAVLTSVATLAGELTEDMTCSPGKDAVDVIYQMIGP